MLKRPMAILSFRPETPDSSGNPDLRTLVKITKMDRNIVALSKQKPLVRPNY